jgi:hypothetical protein
VDEVRLLVATSLLSCLAVAAILAGALALIR